MYLILKENYALRSFRLIPYAYIEKSFSYAQALTKRELNFLLKCDGSTYLRPTKTYEELNRKGLIEICKKGTMLSSWQTYRNCDNRYMPKMNLQLTGRCNYNCIHCFNAKDNAPLQSEISLENVIKLLDECVECGVTSFTITGGEPMVHPHYRRIIEEIYKRNMFVFELNTNGYYITQEMLDWMKQINYFPMIKISFDGLGYHNWMRGNHRAEEITLKAIKLCVDNGFEVMVQMNVNKANLDSILPSLELFDQMGVQETRIIKTTNAPRWKENGKDFTLTMTEYFDVMYDVIKGYASKKRNMDLEAWMLLFYAPKCNCYNFSGIVCKEGEFRESLPLCKGSRGMIGVGANGNTYPCLQSSGWFEEQKICLGNVFKDGLKKVLQDSPFIKLVTTTLKERLKSGSECKDCKFFKVCTGGCPALAILTSGHYLLEDRTKCIFFKQGYIEKYKEMMDKVIERYKNN